MEMNVTISVPSSGCHLRVLAVGGGGGAGYGGGGSGYILSYNETLTTDTVLNIIVGDQRQSSWVTINGQTFEAAPGDDADDGYSGGGAFGGNTEGHDGGSNGEDGENDQNFDGGHGTGEDVTTYKMNNFALTPGAGGKYLFYRGDVIVIDGIYLGGGGGGVLVNRKGPQRDSDNQGEGFGGGAGWHRNSDGDLIFDGLPGVILLEVGNLN